MSANSQNRHENNGYEVLKKMLRDMKHNYISFMTKLGAHITYLSIYCASKIKKTIIKLTKYTGNKSFFVLRKIKAKITDFFTGIKRFGRNTGNFWFWLREDVADTNVNKGFIKASGLFFGRIGKTVWKDRKVFVTAFNWVAPIVSIAFLITVVDTIGNLNYGVSVECNGKEMGVVQTEFEFDQAQKEMQSKINYVTGNEKFTVEPKFAVKVIDNNEEVVNLDELANNIISSSDKEISNATGIYVDGEFMGAVINSTKIKSTMNGILNSYRGDGVKKVEFQKDIEYKEGIYLVDTIVDENEILSILTSNKTVDAYYTAIEGDTPIMIASKNNISYSTLKALNPTIEDSLRIGDKVKLNVAEPYMSVKVVKEATYTQKIDYETVKTDDAALFKGNQRTTQKGVEGEESITAEITIVNGIETNRKVISSYVISQPVTEKISVGTKAPSSKNGVYGTGSGQFCWPVAGGYISAYWGDGRGHKGLDIAAPYGTSIFAAESGTVTMAQWYSGYGYCVMIQHSDGYVTLYGHCSCFAVSVGQKVERGQQIAKIGSTGNSTGNHLHFEVRRYGQYLNPLPYVK